MIVLVGIRYVLLFSRSGDKGVNINCKKILGNEYQECRTVAAFTNSTVGQQGYICI